MALILPSYYKKDKNPDPGPWYVVKSECDELGSLETAQNVKPMFRSTSFLEAENYIKMKGFEYFAKGYEWYDTIDKNMKVMKYKPQGPAVLVENQRKQYVIFAIFSKKEANAGKLVNWNE